MRDDLHKGAPVSRTWKSLIRRCTRDSTWRLDAPLCAKKAIQELTNRIAPGAFASLLKILGEQQLSIDSSQSLNALRLKYSDPLETKVIDQVRLELQRGPVTDPQGTVRDAVRSALREEVDAQLRSASLHVLQKSPGSEKELMHRMRSSLAEASLDQLADDSVIGTPREKIKVRRPIDLDDDIASH
jgi:hypothetical protein